MLEKVPLSPPSPEIISPLLGWTNIATISRIAAKIIISARTVYILFPFFEIKTFPNFKIKQKRLIFKINFIYKINFSDKINFEAY
jgi:hypothetical protein